MVGRGQQLQQDSPEGSLSATGGAVLREDFEQKFNLMFKWSHNSSTWRCPISNSLTGGAVRLRKGFSLDKSQQLALAWLQTLRVLIPQRTVSITLIATGFKRQEDPDSRTSQEPQLGRVDNLGVNRRPSSSLTEGTKFEIPEFLRKKGRSRYPRC